MSYISKEKEEKEKKKKRKTGEIILITKCKLRRTRFLHFLPSLPQVISTPPA